MDLKKHLDRAEDALNRGQSDYAAELCDQVLDFAPGEARAAAVLAQALLNLRANRTWLGRIGAGSFGLAARLSRMTRNAEGEARSRRRAFMKNPSDLHKGYLWAEALERAGYAGAALSAFGALGEFHGEAARQAGALAAAQGDVVQALEHYQKALDANPRDSEALRARKNLAAEQALRTKRYDEAESGFDIARDKDAMLRAARGTDAAPMEGGDPPSGA